MSILVTNKSFKLGSANKSIVIVLQDSELSFFGIH